jgi:hypothetical protein
MCIDAVRGAVRRVAVAVAVAFGGFALFQPDWFHFQNGLDPYFYSGQSLNLRRAVAQGAARHYFLSRWTVYLPEALVQKMFGVETGFVLWRLLLLTSALIAMYSMYDSAPIRRSVLVGSVIAFSPLLVRATFVDYSDAVVVPLGIIAVVLCTGSDTRLRVSSGLGFLGACMMVANPFALFPVALCLGTYLMSFPGHRARARSLAVSVLTGLTVATSGWLLFRIRYGVPNLYAPTWQFIRTHLNSQDPWKSPRLWWLGYRLWIYLPALVVLAAYGLSHSGVVAWTRREALILRMCAIQYLFQIWYQFSRHGSTLEIHYYFTYVIPVYTVALAVVLFRLLERCPVGREVILAAVVIVGLALLAGPVPVRYGSWIDALIVVVALFALVHRYGLRQPVVAPVAVVAVVFSAQLAAPSPEPRLPTESRVEAGYDRAFDRANSEGIAVYRNARVFVDRMATLKPSVLERLSFVIGGGDAKDFGATYAVQVAMPRRWLNDSTDAADHFGVYSVSRTRFVELKSAYIAIICSPEEYAPIRARLGAEGLVLGRSILDVTTSRRRLTRTVVVEAQVH